MSTAEETIMKCLMYTMLFGVAGEALVLSCLFLLAFLEILKVVWHCLKHCARWLRLRFWKK